ncbi:Pseudouridine synthase [Hoyosella subflava DQS3-9A1]|uniref:Pseudouridine synthase n=1 Tax=Hoyosella subflava (strain DSM 45089 / JCM 17490 / NBRC 109087 / DQS3-9A1) TaxID=443218 RepID=F6EJH9_HOYSD|nr:Pseudouridine synthase [Hoyosella subflava DQS3-9A1]
MPHRSPTRQSPLPPRDGIDAAWIRFPDFAPWKTVGEAINARYPAHRERFAERLAQGDVVDQSGAPVHEGSFLRRGMTLFYYRDLPVEDPVPFDITVLYQDNNIVVADKPHFLATMPRGRHVTETATVRLRRLLRLPELTPAHRLDRLTAGLLTLHRSRRGPQRVSAVVRTARRHQGIPRYRLLQRGSGIATDALQPNRQTARRTAGARSARARECD